jgi:8-oxo-dGTP pyrophosphatase MutT (NUDIX family)
MGHYEPGELIPYADTEARDAAWASKDGYEGVTVAGVCIKAEDTGRIFLAQRSMDETDTPEVQETWEFPGGHLKKGEDPFVAAQREFTEEIGFDFPPGEVTDGWRAAAETVRDHYQGFVFVTPTEFDLSEWVETEEVQGADWFDADEVEAMAADGTLRPEIVATMDWSLVWPVSGNLEEDMDDETLLEEPAFTLADLAGGPIPIHGVMAPEEAKSGDARGFTAGSVTSRPYRLPFSWQKSAIAAHDGSVVTGSVDRMMRKDGMIHWEGSLMPNAEAGEFAELLAFFGKFGVSIDGDRGSLDTERSLKTGMTWFDAVRAAGLTAVAIPAFAEAYVAFGPHPEMPDMDDEEHAVLTSSGNMVTFDTVQFKRGPGWVTNPRETKRLHDYWTKKGQPGYKKIAWGTPGDFTRAKKLIGEKIGLNSPEDLKYLNQIIAQWHFDALGYWPGDLGKPGNAPDTPENRRRAATHAGLEDAWETVLVSSATETRVYPPKDWFSKADSTDALVIEDPDEHGLRRTYGYAGEWGICHVGIDGKCQEVPLDPNGGNYPWFHLGRTKVMDEDGSITYVNTGLITYGKAHRSAQEILSETPTQAHFDDLRHAWAAVTIGEDERGVWFSGVVLPTVEDKWLTAIEASGQVSGEWKRGELRTLLTVNVAGFPVMRSSAAYDEEGNLLALSASALSMPFEICEPPEDAICGYVNAAGDKCLEPATWGVWLNPDSYDLCCPSHVEYLQADHECPDEPEQPTAKERIETLALIEAEERWTKAKAQFAEAELLES